MAEALGLMPADILASGTRLIRPPPNCPIYQKRDRAGWSNLPVYFEQRLVGTIGVDKNGPGFTYDPDWVALSGAFPISITMPFKSGANRLRHFSSLGANLLPKASNCEPLDNSLACPGAM